MEIQDELCNSPIVSLIQGPEGQEAMQGQVFPETRDLEGAGCVRQERTKQAAGCLGNSYPEEPEPKRRPSTLPCPVLLSCYVYGRWDYLVLDRHYE